MTELLLLVLVLVLAGALRGGKQAVASSGRSESSDGHWRAGVCKFGTTTVYFHPPSVKREESSGDVQRARAKENRAVQSSDAAAGSPRR